MHWQPEMHDTNAPRPRRSKLWLTREVVAQLAANAHARAPDTVVTKTNCFFGCSGASCTCPPE